LTLINGCLSGSSFFSVAPLLVALKHVGPSHRPLNVASLPACSRPRSALFHAIEVFSFFLLGYFSLSLYSSCHILFLTPSRATTLRFLFLKGIVFTIPPPQRCQ
jgi:hypothetical protein